MANLLDTPTPPAVKNARIVRGLGDGPDEKINHSAKARKDRMPRLTTTQEQVVISEYRQHMQKLAKNLNKVRKAHAASRKEKIALLAIRFGVSPTAIKCCVGQK